MARPTRPRSYDIASTELRERLANVMLDVENGATVTVTRYGKIIARIVPTEAVVDPAADPFDFSAIHALLPDDLPSGVEMLLEERRSSR